MNDDVVKFNQRVSDALFYALDSDFYSSDGAIWDQYASTVYFIETSNNFKRLVIEEAGDKELKASSLDELSPSLSDLILRVEARLAQQKNTPVGRNYGTMIAYTYDDKKLGKKVKGYLDLKTASDDDLQSMIDDIPEARKELMYRALTEKNNNTK